jgi:beta-lactamase regulating signal transducer with metallopeptidase domain
VIYVPMAWRSWSDETRRIVVDHELAHHARHDPMLRWMAELACAVNWFNPAVWWMARRLVMQCEFACDAEVIASGVGENRYVGVLCDLAVGDADARPIAAMALRSTLEKRVIRLANIRDRGGNPCFPSSRCWILGGMLAIAGTAFAMMGPSPVQSSTVPASEVQTRWSANPFPAESR